MLSARPMTRSTASRSSPTTSTSVSSVDAVVEQQAPRRRGGRPRRHARPAPDCCACSAGTPLGHRQSEGALRRRSRAGSRSRQTTVREHISAAACSVTACAAHGTATTTRSSRHASRFAPPVTSPRIDAGKDAADCRRPTRRHANRSRPGARPQPAAPPAHARALPCRRRSPHGVAASHRALDPRHAHPCRASSHPHPARWSAWMSVE